MLLDINSIWEKFKIPDGRYRIVRAEFVKDRGIKLSSEMNFIPKLNDIEAVKESIKQANRLGGSVELTFIFDIPKMVQPEKVWLANLLELIFHEFDKEYGALLMLAGTEGAFIEETGTIVVPHFSEIKSQELNAEATKKFEKKFEEYCGQRVSIEFRTDNKDKKKRKDSRKQDSCVPVKVRTEKRTPSVSATSSVPGNVIHGRDFKTKEIRMKDFNQSSTNIAVRGKIFFIDAKLTKKKDRYIVSIKLSDGTSSVFAKFFPKKEKWNRASQHLKDGDYVKISGSGEWSDYDKMSVLLAKNVVKVEGEHRTDNSPEGCKRVELHAHTKMSDMDGLNEIEELIKTAAQWGHKAVAITDHGVVQAFPEAAHAAEKFNIKVLYGMEGYLYDDEGCIDDEGNIDYRKKERRHHIILLAKDLTGLKNLYKLVSISHLEYFYLRPTIPRSVLDRHREGLIIGSACEAGELYRGIVAGFDDERLEKLAAYYDYLEIQPAVNNRYMIDSDKIPGVSDFDDIRNMNRKVVELGERLEKPVVATCDTHYLNAEDYVFRRVLQDDRGYSDLDKGGLYFRTTEEMLEEFSYLGEAKAYEIVVENTQMIAEQIQNINPTPREKYPPQIENADEILRNSCYEKAHEIYGSPLPEPIEQRLQSELKAIIDEGYAVMYVSSKILVEKANKAGYVVGSRGSVGSSFAATMAGITEVNPLPPHYICKKCKYLEWGDESVYDCGVDMESKECPDCGAKLYQDGFMIPFETFLGIPGKQKEPDIDLNFPGEYQETAQKYVGEIFGESNVYKAGTIGTLAHKNAFIAANKYSERNDLNLEKTEIERLGKGCEGVKKTTGQHAGGIIIVPEGKEIYDFCPVNRPANKRDANFVTTHFDYHAIDNNLLKLDLLGHDVPSIIRSLYDMTGIDPTQVSLKDERVIDIFRGIDSLDIKNKKDYILKHGSFGIPEFGTKFVRDMLDDTKPQKFADLVRISGFSHGTNVWLGNAKEFIKNGQATMDNAISTRDDIMNYLNHKGVPNVQSFTIMEKVRKGKGVTEEEAGIMLEHGVPQWYVDSCRLISYMFPRAHAVAYVLMAYRIAYFKVYHPLAFYAAYLSTKIDDFPWDIVSKGLTAVKDHIKKLYAKGNAMEKKEKAQLVPLEVCYEMMARGYEFSPPCLYPECEAMKFRVKDGRIIVPICAIAGVGQICGETVVGEYKKRPFISIEDAQIRGNINKSNLESLKESGLFHGLEEKNQMTFDEFI